MARLSFRDQLIFRDDLRIRSGAARFPRGSMGRKTESAVRTAQMITPEKRAANSRVCEETGRAQSRRGAAASDVR